MKRHATRTVVRPRKTRATKASRPAGARAQQPLKLTKTRRPHPEAGPAEWLVPNLEASYLRLQPADTPTPATRTPFESQLRPGSGAETLAPAASSVWLDRLAEYRRRQGAHRVARAAVAPSQPGVPGGRNWLPLGPTSVLNGQTVGGEAVGGRVSGIAITPGGQIVYVASAAGGVFRSDDGGNSWRSVMDGFDIDPTSFASASLASGAIAVDQGDPNRVYVGTGEGDTSRLFQLRITKALPAYRGIGPIRTDDGGMTWVVEQTIAASPTLVGQSFFALALDPANRENVVAATTAGIYQRRVAAGGNGEWTQRRAGMHSSVVAARAGGTTTFIAATWGGGVFSSKDGQTWSTLGTGFPTNDVGRITLGVQADNPNVVYALAARNSSGVLHGVYRLDGLAGAWKTIANPPAVLPVADGASQGDYDLALSVDPTRPDRIYLGGSYYNTDPFPGSIWRADVQPAGGGFAFANAKSIGTHAHADVHVLVHSPGDSDELWCGCDGGLFLNRNPSGDGEFAGQNNGLSCLCCNFIAQHPTDPQILLTGLQDNGTARTSGSSMWTHVNYGDGGYCLINWANPNKVLSFANGTVYRATNGGTDHNAWSAVWKFGWATMTQPIVGTPRNPASPAEAETIAVGAGSMVFISDDFANSWPKNGQIQLPGGVSVGSVFALTFASRDRLFAGTTTGVVFRLDRSAAGWTVSRIDNAAAGALGMTGLISDIEIDWADATRSSVYLCFGGLGDRRRVWRFDSTRWEARSGPAAGNNLLDVEHNALIVDPSAPANIYVGADIGVWHSADSGVTWAPLENGLPDAPVFDLQLHDTQRLLRAATYGRGVYEIPL